MNAIAMILQHPEASKGMLDKSERETESSLFQTLLCNEQAEALTTTSLQPLLRIEEGTETQLQDSLSLPPDELEDLEAKDLLEVTYPFLHMMMDVKMGGKLVTASEGVLNKAKEMNVLKTIDSPRVDAGQMMDHETVMSKLREIFIGMESLLAQMENEQGIGIVGIAKVAPKILELLQQWSDLDKKLGNLKHIDHTFVAAENKESKAGKIVSELIEKFQKRERLVVKQQYHTNAEVTSKDVSNWIHKALNTNSQVEQIIGQQGITNTSMPMSKLEQYVIHLNDNQATKPDKQLVEQFQKVMKSSGFLAKQNGVNQLSITLRPNNLGEMMVRLTQIDGEMTVKIIVTSHTSKQMLESNMHQLRNMFSPQQVVIERQELTSQQGQDVQQEQKDQPLKDQKEKQSQHPDQREEHHTDDDFATQFHELLMNEKV